MMLIDRRSRIRVWRAPELHTSRRTADQRSKLFTVGSLRPRRRRLVSYSLRPRDPAAPNK
jgi:hypothetical protein